MSTLTATPGQTIGPFFGYALPFERGNELVPPGTAGAIRLHGIVTDGAGAPVPDALLEIWQADADGTVPRSPGRCAATAGRSPDGAAPAPTTRALQLHHRRTRCRRSRIRRRSSR